MVDKTYIDGMVLDMTVCFGSLVDQASLSDHELVVGAYNGLLGPAYRQSAYIAVDAPVADPDGVEAVAAALIRQDLTGTATMTALAVPA